MSESGGSKRKFNPHLNSSHPAEHAEDGEGNWLVSYADMMTLLVGFFVILNSFAKVDNEKLEEVRKSVSKEFGGKYQVPYKDITERLIAELKKMGLSNQFKIKQTNTGVEISFFGPVFFELGSAEVRNNAKLLLSGLIPIIQSEATDFDVTIEGHTDDIPLSLGGVFRNNWELSSIRACRVLDYFAESGFRTDRLTAVGYGEARPLLPNRTAQGEAIVENQNQNRRVVIKLNKHDEPIIGSETKAAVAPVPAPEAVPAPAQVPAAAPAVTQPNEGH